jgi:hypothetical protein
MLAPEPPQDRHHERQRRDTHVIALSDDVVIKLLVGIPIALYGASVTGKRIVKRWWAPFDSLTNGASSDPARPRNRPRPRPIAGPRNRPRPMGHRHEEAGC